MWQALAPFRGMIFGGLLAALGLGLMVGSIVQFAAAANLAENGIETAATVIDRWTRDGDDDVDYTLRYQFTHDGTAHIETRNVPAEVFDAHPINTTFVLRIKTDDPSVHEVFAGELAAKARNTLLGGLFFFAFGALFFWLTARRAMAKRRLDVEQGWPDV
jgi:hypothetical protein